MSESSSPQQHAGAEVEANYLDIPGVRFMPSDQELILDYLRAKLHGENPPTDIVQEADVYGEHPKELTRRLGRSVEDFWYAFSKRERKYPKGTRPCQSTGTDGRWKPVGKNRPVLGADKEIIGQKCTLAYEVFVYDDDQPQRSRRRMKKTEWKMCEFVSKDTDKPISSSPDNMLLNEWVLCKITTKARACERSSEEDDGQAALVDEPPYEDEQLQNATPPDVDPSQQAQVQDLVDGSVGTELGTQGFDADVEPPCAGDRLKDVQFVGYDHHPEPWNECGEEFYHHEQQNVHGMNRFGATTHDPDPMASQFEVPADPDPSPLEAVPTEPEPWDMAGFLFSDEIVKPKNDAGKGNAAAANKASEPATDSGKGVCSSTTPSP